MLSPAGSVKWLLTAGGRCPVGRTRCGRRQSTSGGCDRLDAFKKTGAGNSNVKESRSA